MILGLVLGGVAAWKVSSWRSGLVIAGMELAAAEAVAQAKIDADLVEDLQKKVGEAVALADLLRRQEREVIERVVNHEIIEYVQTDNAVDCGLSAAGVRIHDAAASGRLPGVSNPASPTDGATSGASNAEVMQVVVPNYHTCNAIRDRLIGLQDWVSRAAAAARNQGEKTIAGPSSGA